MGSLIAPTRRAGKSGNFVHGTLEALTLGKATVKITGSNQRLTNLDVLSSNLAVGNKVIVDYSSGTPPFVRGHGREITWPERYLEVGFDSIASPMASDEIYASIISLEDQIVTKDTDFEIQFETMLFDETGIFNDEDGFEVLEEGAYYVSAQVILDGITCSYDHRNRIWASLVGDTYGPFAFATAHQHKYDPDYQITLCVGGAITAAIGEKITCKIWLDPAFGQNSCDLVVENTGNTYASLSPCMQIFRFGGGFFASSMAGIYSQEFGSREDPSLIELESNNGYLYVAQSDDYVRALGNTQEQTNLNVVLDFQFQDVEVGDSYANFFIKTSNDWYSDTTPTTGYGIQISSKGGWSVWRYDSGSPTFLGTYNSPATALWQKLEFQVNGSQVSAKTWVNGEAEPGWQVDVTDGSPLSSDGRFQLSYYSVSGSHVLRIDNVVVDTP